MGRKRNSTDGEMDRVLENAVALLFEHFRSVQIIAVHEDEDRAVRDYSIGRGYWHDRVNATREWLMREDEAAREQARRRVKDDD